MANGGSRNGAHIMLQAVPAWFEQAEQLKDEQGLPDWERVVDY